MNAPANIIPFPAPSVFESEATVAAFLNPQPVRMSDADAWEAGRADRITTLESWSAFAKTPTARGYRASKADAEQFRLAPTMER